MIFRCAVFKFINVEEYEALYPMVRLFILIILYISYYKILEGDVWIRLIAIFEWILIGLLLGNLIEKANAFGGSSVLSLFERLVYYLPFLLAPTKELAKRLTFLLIGVAIIFGLSEVSKQVERLSTAAAKIEAQH